MTFVPSFIPDDTLQKKVSCTACGKQVNQFQRNSVHEHPVLKVLICKVGKSRYTSHLFFVTVTMSFTNVLHVYNEFSLLPFFFYVLMIKFFPLFLQLCYKYYTSDDISRDSDGMDEQCR